MLDLLPSEWEVLTMIDGQTDLRQIASNLARSDFDIAKVVYGLVSTAVVTLRVPASIAERVSQRMPTPSIAARLTPTPAEATTVVMEAVKPPAPPPPPPAPRAPSITDELP